MKRYATAQWKGSIKNGSGTVSTETGVLKDNKYTFASRFESGDGTNPEELVAAAHVGCFCMKLSGNLTEAGFEPTSLDGRCDINLEESGITGAHINLEARVDGISEEKFNELVEDAKENCPISQLLDTKITVSSKLN